MIVYGIKNCNTVKNALDWLKKHRIEFEFHDYKKSGITAAKLTAWSKQVGWESLVNKRGHLAPVGRIRTSKDYKRKGGHRLNA